MTEDEFIEWKQIPQTKEFLTFLLREEHAHRLVVAEGACRGEDNVAQCYLMHITEADVYNRLANIQYEELIEDDGEVEATWPQGADSA